MISDTLMLVFVPYKARIQSKKANAIKSGSNTSEDQTEEQTASGLTSTLRSLYAYTVMPFEQLLLRR